MAGKRRRGRARGPGRARPGAAGPRHPGELTDAVTLAAAASLLRVSVRTVQNYVRRGLLRPFYLPGSARPRIPLAQVNGLRRASGKRGR